jgi:hypothetical protein
LINRKPIGLVTVGRMADWRPAERVDTVIAKVSRGMKSRSSGKKRSRRLFQKSGYATDRAQHLPRRHKM